MSKIRHPGIFCAVDSATIERDFTKFVPDVLTRYGVTRPTLEAAIKRGEFPKLFRFAGVHYSKNSHLDAHDERVKAAFDAVEPYASQTADEAMS
jgi:hypothetical protein